MSDGEPEGSQYIELIDDVFANGLQDWVAQELRDQGGSSEFYSEREIAGWIAQLSYLPQDDQLLHITLLRPDK